MIAAPLWRLALRRANAVGNPIAIVLVSWLLTLANLFEAGGHIQTLINVYQIGVFELIQFLKNKVEPLSP